MLKKSLHTLGALLIVLSGVLATSPPASAACSSDYVCLYQNTSWGGGKYTNNFYVNGDNDTYHDGDTFNNGYHLYDAVSSYENGHPTWYVDLWSAHYFQGTRWRIYPGESRSSMIGFNDVASSHYWTSF